MLAKDRVNTKFAFRSEQFELWFQPVYAIVSGDVLHNEVLLRWRNHQGLLYSKDFLPHVSSHGSQWLDCLVVDRVVDLLVHHPNSCLSVNVSEDSLQDFTLVHHVQTMIANHQFNPRTLSFEVAESAIARNFPIAKDFIQTLKELGCLVVIDGFTNQRLSTQQWKQLQIDLIKIDSTLIQASEANSNSLRNIVETSHSLGQLVIAKSVDGSTTPYQLDRQGITYAQGDYFKSPSPHPSFKSKVNILNVPIDNLSRTELLEQLELGGTLFTPNVDHLIKLQTDKEFLQAYNIADYKVCDSQILLYTSKFLGLPIKEKISGSDFFPAFYSHHKNNENITIFLLGGAHGTANRASEKINCKVQRNIVVGSYSPSFGFETNEQECLEIIEMINQSKATVLAIGVGAPKQEKWLYKYRDKLLHIKIFLAIGATIDFEAGKVKRAPKFISNVGLEWLYRLLSEPKRLWKRYLIDGLSFFPLVMQQRLKSQ